MLHRQLADCQAFLSSSDLASISVERVWPVVERFERFLRARNVQDLDAAGQLTVRLFIESRTSFGLKPSTATMHDRRSTVRLLYRVARRLELTCGDPTLDLDLPPRTSTECRPLTDAEIDLGRDAALWSLSTRRYSRLWALAEATARGAELHSIRITDLDISDSRVWIHGGSRTLPRWGCLTDWGTRILATVDPTTTPDCPIVYAGDGKGIAGQVATCAGLSTILVRAGLAGEKDIRPSSVAAWAGHRLFVETGDIALVAGRLGLKSLDQAARTIGWDWSN